MTELYIPRRENSIDLLTEFHDRHSSYILEHVKDEEEQASLLNKLAIKLSHSFIVGSESTDTMNNLGIFHPNIVELSYHPFLLHDIGRFLQISLIRDMADFKIKNMFPNINDHGELGKKILIADEQILKFFPDTRIYDFFVSNVVGYHVHEQNSLPIEYSSSINICDKAFLDGNMDLLFKSRNADILRLISYSIKILKDIDKLDIYRQITDGRIKPEMSPEIRKPIHQEILDMFYSGEYINRQELTKQQKWSTNASQLLWWGFLYNTVFVSTIEKIRQENMLEDMWVKTRAHEIEELKTPYEFTRRLLRALIATSENGIIINTNQAINKTRKEMGMKPLVRTLKSD